jgi:DNA helicase IV
LIDEANCLVNGPPFTFGHVVVDESQDLSAVALRCVGRRSPSGSFTILGDLAQSTTPAGQSDWAAVQRFLGTDAQTVAVLTVGYRVPAPILELANRLLPFTAVEVVESRSVRQVGERPGFVTAAAAALAEQVAATVAETKHHHKLTGIVAPERLHDAIATALMEHRLAGVGHVQKLAHHEVPVFGAEAVKGLEFDAVVVVNPHEILDGTARGARLLYVAMTRAVQQLTFVADSPLPDVLQG